MLENDVCGGYNRIIFVLLTGQILEYCENSNNLVTIKISRF